MHRLSRTGLSIILALLLPLFAVLAGHAQDFTEQDALAVTEDAVKDHPLILAEPEPVIRVHGLADSSVNIADYWASAGT